MCSSPCVVTLGIDSPWFRSGRRYPSRAHDGQRRHGVLSPLVLARLAETALVGGSRSGSETHFLFRQGFGLWGWRLTRLGPPIDPRRRFRVAGRRVAAARVSALPHERRPIAFPSGQSVPHWREW